MEKAATTGQAPALRVIREQISEAMAAPKCHGCGCLHKTVEALSDTEAGKTELAALFREARSVFTPKQYDCLGCPVCYPAIAANAFADAFPEVGSGLESCPTDEPAERYGWPPLPGDYHVVRYRAPVAVCTLNSASVAQRLGEDAQRDWQLLAPYTPENLGIERIIRNTLANPNIRFLVLCGADTQQAIGHLPGQSLQSLFENGVDERGRIRGARGKRPVLKNVSVEEIQAFVEQVELISMIGEESSVVISEQVEASRTRDTGPYAGAPNSTHIEIIQAAEPDQLTLDRAGYFVVYPDRRAHRLVLEHYTNAGVLDCVIEGLAGSALYAEAIRRHLLERLDHAAYLGRELARARALIPENRTFRIRRQAS